MIERETKELEILRNKLDNNNFQDGDLKKLKQEDSELSLKIMRKEHQ
jgi:hypothetical protein